MASSQIRNAILEEVMALVNQQAPTEQRRLVVDFVKYYYARVAVEDLQAKGVDILAATLLSHWHAIYQRAPGQCKLRVFNPQTSSEGWPCAYTAVQVIFDDMPFMVDSMQMEINRLGLSTHLIIHIGGIKFRRDAEHKIIAIFPPDADVADASAEAPIYFEIDRQADPVTLETLQVTLLRILNDVAATVTDWPMMRQRLEEMLVELADNPSHLDIADFNEAKDYIRWLLDDHFIFLGCRDYQMEGQAERQALKIIPNTGFGVLRDKLHTTPVRPFSLLPKQARQLLLSPQVLIIANTNTKATVHRPVYTVYIGVKRFDNEGKMIGERRFVGLFTSSAYNSDPRTIPFVRQKAFQVMQRSGLPRTGHAAKALWNILETFPRDDLFQIDVDTLFDIAMGILQLQDRRLMRFFAWRDPYNRFFSCFFYLPRDRVSTELRRKLKRILMEELHGTECTHTIFYSDLLLARIHFVVRVDSKKIFNYDFVDLEQKLIAMAHSWVDELESQIRKNYADERSNQLCAKYRNAFPAGYRDDFTAQDAVADINYIEKVSSNNSLELSLYRLAGQAKLEIVRFKLFQLGVPIALSDVLPILENLGLKVWEERPHQITFADGSIIWASEFSMQLTDGGILDISQVKSLFLESFRFVWEGLAQNDGFNRLVLNAHMGWREVMILRAYSNYFRQTGFNFSQDYIQNTLTKHSVIAKQLVDLFKLRFDPSHLHDTKAQEQAIIAALDAVTNLDEDKILRRFLIAIKATLRTNYFQQTIKGKAKSYISYKIDPTCIPDLPLPRPQFEIFVFSTQFEGVHLRGSKVARGGIRWSDRREDFRTEILGLMKAQQVKNAVIVPSGAKGGFVPKRLAAMNGNREAVLTEAIDCYKNYIRGLLDLTDNIVAQKIVPPEHTRCYDDDDPYLVVAADKGTATFSDTANGISAEYNFWLGDAFASGGSAGYDHKKMGITARGAWESVKRHFRLLGINPEQQVFTAIGIGDMSGDVFGNGVLLSKHMKLVAAFNHQHIFLDPNPDPATSYAERERLFVLPRSTWEDYNPALISSGGGVFSRAAKAIPLSAEIKQLLAVETDSLAPNELIHAILQAQVDLLWNGGIGTYVKATAENHLEVGDRANDNLRINGSQLRCKIVGEGGNLGFTQLGRVEYALNGGLIYTDFIDNSAGVDCSDHEVNIKILLNHCVANRELTLEQRNELLAQMTDDVAALVLKDNYFQTQALSQAVDQMSLDFDLYCRYMGHLEKSGALDRILEFLPDNKQLLERKMSGKGFTAPELAVILAYSKIEAKHLLLQTDVPEDPYLANAMRDEFPTAINVQFPQQMVYHSLRREIIATQLTNAMINDMGPVFVHRMQDEVGAPISAIVRAYKIAEQVFSMRELMAEIAALDYRVAAPVQLNMMLRVNRLIRRATRWFLRYRGAQLAIQENINYFSIAQELYDTLPDIISGAVREKFVVVALEYTQAGVPKKLAEQIAITSALISACDMVELTTENHLDITSVATTYFTLGESLELGWLREQISNHPVADHWDALARAGLRDDLDTQQRRLTQSVLQLLTKKRDHKAALELWSSHHRELIQRWHAVLNNLRSAPKVEFIMYAVALRQLLDLTRASGQAVKSKALA